MGPQGIYTVGLTDTYLKIGLLSIFKEMKYVENFSKD